MRSAIEWNTTMFEIQRTETHEIKWADEWEWNNRVAAKWPWNGEQWDDGHYIFMPVDARKELLCWMEYKGTPNNGGYWVGSFADEYAVAFEQQHDLELAIGRNHSCMVADYKNNIPGVDSVWLEIMQVHNTPGSYQDFRMSCDNDLKLLMSTHLPHTTRGCECDLGISDWYRSDGSTGLQQYLVLMEKRCVLMEWRTTTHIVKKELSVREVNKLCVLFSSWNFYVPSMNNRTLKGILRPSIRGVWLCTSSAEHIWTAVHMCLHDRLGRSSGLRVLGTDLLLSILQISWMVVFERSARSMLCVAGQGYDAILTAEAPVIEIE